MTRLLLLGVLMAADVSSQLEAMWKSLEPRSDRPVSWSVHLTPALFGAPFEPEDVIARDRDSTDRHG